jgi:hypothetical protein
VGRRVGAAAAVDDTHRRPARRAWQASKSACSRRSLCRSAASIEGCL